MRDARRAGMQPATDFRVRSLGQIEQIPHMRRLTGETGHVVIGDPYQFRRLLER